MNNGVRQAFKSMNPSPIIAGNAQKFIAKTLKNVNVSQIVDFDYEIKHRDTHADQYTNMVISNPAHFV